MEFWPNSGIKQLGFNNMLGNRCLCIWKWNYFNIGIVICTFLKYAVWYWFLTGMLESVLVLKMFLFPNKRLWLTFSELIRPVCLESPPPPYQKKTTKTTTTKWNIPKIALASRKRRTFRFEIFTKCFKNKRNKNRFWLIKSPKNPLKTNLFHSWFHLCLESPTLPRKTQPKQQRQSEIYTNLL